MEEKKIQAIVTFVRGVLGQTKETLQVSEDLAFLLLDHYHWDQNELVSNWDSSKDELINMLHINTEGEVSLESKLDYKECGFGLCPVCNEAGKRLYQLYCGHRICKECLIEDVKNAVVKARIPVCRQDCNAELLAHDVERILPGSKHAKAYKWWRINKSFSNSNYNVAICPNPLCRFLIIHQGELPNKSIQCPKCEHAFCNECLNESHAPLCCCEHATEFVEDIANQLRELEEEEDKWYKKEKRVIEYRFQNKDDTIEGFNIGIRAMAHAQKKEQEEVLQQIKNAQLFSDLVLTEITETDDKIRELVSKKKNPEKVEELTQKVISLRNELETYKNYKEELEKENEARKAERKKELDFYEAQKELFMSGILNREKYDVYINQYRENFNNLAEEKAKEIPNEEDCIRKNTFLCPSCKARFYKVNPCCEVTCVCGYDFCTLCNEPWITHKKGYCECQNDLKQKPVDYDDPSDLPYRPCPYTLEKKIFFAKWRRFHDLFVVQKSKYDELHQRFLAFNAETRKETEQFTKLRKILEQQNVNDARTVAMKLVNTALYAQSVTSWGHVASFYVRISEFTNGYLEKLQTLATKNEGLIALLNEPENHTAKEFDEKMNEVKAEIDLVLKDKF